MTAICHGPATIKFAEVEMGLTEEQAKRKRKNA